MNPALEVNINFDAAIPQEHRAVMHRHAMAILRIFRRAQLSSSLSISVLMNVLGFIICGQMTGGRHRPLTSDEMATAAKILTGFDRATLNYFAMFGADRTTVAAGKAKA